MGWAERASRDRRRREKWAPGAEGQDLARVRELASQLTAAQIEALCAQQPDTLLRAEMRKLMLPLARRT